MRIDLTDILDSNINHNKVSNEVDVNELFVGLESPLTFEEVLARPNAVTVCNILVEKMINFNHSHQAR